MLSRVRALASSASADLYSLGLSCDLNVATASSMSRWAYQTVHHRLLGEVAHRRAIAERRTPARSCGVSLAVKELSRPATAKLAASRFTSHSNGAGQRLVEVVDVEDERALRGGEGAEVGQVGVAAELDAQPGGRCGRQVRGHRQRGTAIEGERRDQHPAVTHRDELGNPRGSLRQQEPDGVPV